MANNPYTASARIETAVREINDEITQGMKARGYSAANELRNSSQKILRGRRNGREYIVPGTGRMRYYKRGSKDGKHGPMTATITYKKYRASAPGEPPAVRTNEFREKWQPRMEIDRSTRSFLSIKSYIENDVRVGKNHEYLLGELLENGTGRMAPRPHHDSIKQDALPKILRIYSRPYI